MTIETLEAVVTVPESRAVLLQLPPDVKPGRHRIVATIEDATEPAPALKPLAEAFPVIAGASHPFVFPVIPEAQWPDDMPLRREDMYGDDGR